MPFVYWHLINISFLADVEAFVVAQDDSTFYAGAWGEGVYRSTDHGATWQPANAGITLPLHIQGGLAVNPGITR